MTGVLLTRPTPDDRLAGRLAEDGLRVTHVPTVITAAEPPGGQLDEAVRLLPRFDWVVVTSATAVRAMADVASRLGLPLPVNPPQWAVVGPATATALEAQGIAPAAIPVKALGESIPDALAAVSDLRRARILLPRADAADEALPAALRQAGAAVTEVVAYRTVEAPESSREDLAAALADPEVRAVVVASGSAVRGLVILAEQAGGRENVDRLAIVSIGPSTSAEVRRLGLRLAAEASTPTPEALAEAVVSAVQETDP